MNNLLPLHAAVNLNNKFLSLFVSIKIRRRDIIKSFSCWKTSVEKRGDHQTYLFSKLGTQEVNPYGLCNDCLYFLIEKVYQNIGSII